jgi:hypothetical protein
MTPVLLLALAAPPAPAPAPAPPASLEGVAFDLKLYRPSARPDCGDPAAAGILVCGRRPGNAYPLDKMARQFEAGPMDAETGLFGQVRGRAWVEHVSFPGGQEANRIMFGIKLPF